MKVRITTATATERFVSTAVTSATSHDEFPKRTMARIINVVDPVTIWMIRSPRHTGSDQNERNCTRHAFHVLGEPCLTICAVIWRCCRKAVGSSVRCGDGWSDHPSLHAEVHIRGPRHHVYNQSLMNSSSRVVVNLQ